jgi:hypothetical protein
MSDRGRFGKLISPLVNATGDSEKIVGVAAARALQGICTRSPAGSRFALLYDSLKDFNKRPSISTPRGITELLRHPAVTGDLWLPPRERAVTLASGTPRRQNLLDKADWRAKDPILAKFAAVAGEAFDPAWCGILERQKAGNEVAVRIAELGKDWTPDTSALFKIYLSLFRQATQEKLSWMGPSASEGSEGTAVDMPSVVPGYTGALTTSWQLAWAASRSPIEKLLKEIGPSLNEASPKVRWAAAQFLEEAARYGWQDDPPVFGFEVDLGTGVGEGSSREPMATAIPEMGSVPPSPPPEVTASVTPSPKPTPRNPPPRFGDVKFFRDEANARGEELTETTILHAKRWYWMEVAVRERLSGLKPEEKTKPIRPVKQENDIKVLVTLESDECEFESQVGEIVLPPIGDSKRNACFRLRMPQEPKEHPVRIEVRLFYRFNLIEHLTVTAKFASSEGQSASPVLGRYQNDLCREYLDFDEFRPRKMNIHVSHQGDDYLFEFTLTSEKDESVVLRAKSRLTSTDLQRSLERLRGILENLVLHDYLKNLEGSRGQFRDALRKLAEEGGKLRLALFRNEPRSPLDIVGNAIRERPIESEGIIQVSMPGVEGGFLFPWAFIYDLALPEKSHELPDPKGFWGYRYAIEQLLRGSVNHVDAPKQTDGHMSMAFMLWEEFPNAQEQKQLMCSLNDEASGRLIINDPPVTQKDDFYRLLKEQSPSILYFYTHGHSVRPSSEAKASELCGMVRAMLNSLPADSPEGRLLESMLKRLEEQPDESDSYIELSSGKVRYYEMLERVETLDSTPFVFLNMCESAEMIPLLSESLVSLFLKLGAPAVLGTECTMTISFAHPFSQVYLRLLLSGVPLAYALRTARQHFLDKNNPLGLAYTLFGSGTLSFLPPALGGDKPETMRRL